MRMLTCAMPQASGPCARRSATCLTANACSRYRLLRALRADSVTLPGFDHVAYVGSGAFETRCLAEVVDEFVAVRGATVALMAGTAPERFAFRLPVGSGSITARALAYLIAGHERHHQHLLRTRYLSCMPAVP